MSHLQKTLHLSFHNIVAITLEKIAKWHVNIGKCNFLLKSSEKFTNWAKLYARSRWCFGKTNFDKYKRSKSWTL